MDTLNKIKETLGAEMTRYEAFVLSALQSDNEHVSDMLNYIIANRGKGIRPILSLLMAGIHSQSGSLGKRNYLAALIVEMLHTASLVHDDVVDKAVVRHGNSSVNAIWGPHSAVLVGDYILARTFSMGMESGQFDIVNYITGCMSALCEGELIQSHQSKKFEMTRNIYLDIIFKKTATLIGTSCGVGALSSGAPSVATGLARQAGLYMGMAFQIKDDILDYAPQAQTGKSSCADLREHKITLPLLAVLEKCSEMEQQHTFSLLKECDDQPANITAVCDFVIARGGLEAAAQVMNDYLDKARKLILTYRSSKYRESLLEICDYIGERDK